MQIQYLKSISFWWPNETGLQFFSNIYDSHIVSLRSYWRCNLGCDHFWLSIKHNIEISSRILKIVLSMSSNSIGSHYNLIIILQMLKDDNLICSDVTWKSWHLISLATQSLLNSLCYLIKKHQSSIQIAKFMGPTWGPPGTCRPKMGPMWSSWTLLSGHLTPVDSPHKGPVIWDCVHIMTSSCQRLPLNERENIVCELNF